MIVEDQARFRDAFQQVLSQAPDIDLLGIAPDLPQGRRMFDQMQPEVLLVDLDLPGGSGIELIPPCAPHAVAMRWDGDPRLRRRVPGAEQH